MDNNKKLDDEKAKQIRTSFLEKTGNKIRDYREKKNISQSVLGDCLDLSASMISRIENGTTDMQMSNLPLISLYCDFPLSELFPKDESKEFLDTFSKAVNLTAKRYAREKKTEITYADRRFLKKRVYDVNGVEVTEDVAIKMPSRISKEMYRRCMYEVDVVPMSDKELFEYLKSKDSESIDAVIEAGKLIEHLEKLPKKELTIRSLTNLILNEVVIDRISENAKDEQIKRIYAYYIAMLEKYKNED